MGAAPTFTAEQQLANLNLAEHLWRSRVKPSDVVGGLRMWTCGTQACFGGHLATWPEFREMGVRLLGEAAENPMWCAAPAFDTETWGWSVGVILFGSHDIFDERGGSGLDCAADDEDLGDLDDHAMVLHRIARQRERLQSRIADGAEA